MCNPSPLPSVLTTKLNSLSASSPAAVISSTLFSSSASSSSSFVTTANSRSKKGLSSSPLRVWSRRRSGQRQGKRPHPSAVFLFPGGRDLSLFSTEGGPLPSIHLVVFDGTWKQAKKMVAASTSFLEQFAIRVSLGIGI